LGGVAQWGQPGLTEQQALGLIARSPELIEVILRSPNLGNLSAASLEALDRLALRVFEVKKEHLDLIFKRLSESSTQTIESFSNLLGDLRLNQVSLLSDLVYQKLKTLDLLETVTRDVKSTESAVHRIIERNSWILGKGFEIVRSDKPLATYLDTKVRDDPGTLKRRDLIVKRVPNSNDVVIVELKAPGIRLGAANIGQVLEYKAIVKRHRPNIGQIHCFLFGYEKGDTFTKSSDVEIQSFGELIANLRDEYREYSELLEEGRQEEASVSLGEMAKDLDYDDEASF